MTETLTEREAFEQRIAAEPECDTARLVFADWLEEQPTNENPCRVYGCTKGQIYRMRECKDGILRNAWGDCEVCKGAGVVVDTSDRDRAEFIRLQITAHNAAPFDKLRGRYLSDAATILQRNLAKWKRHKCPECKGTGVTGEGQDAVRCVACDGIGDLLLRLDGGRPSREVSRNPQFRRGFIDSVECTLAELGEERCRTCKCNAQESGERGGGCMYCDGGLGRSAVFVPSPWATAIVKALPVTRFVITDVEPEPDTPLSWDFDGQIPNVLHAACRPSDHNPQYPVGHPTREAAIDALALAVGRIVRKAVYG